jgi:hypothetical protein
MPYRRRIQDFKAIEGKPDVAETTVTMIISDDKRALAVLGCVSNSINLYRVFMCVCV